VHNHFRVGVSHPWDSTHLNTTHARGASRRGAARTDPRHHAPRVSSLARGASRRGAARTDLRHLPNTPDARRLREPPYRVGSPRLLKLRISAKVASIRRSMASARAAWFVGLTEARRHRGGCTARRTGCGGDRNLGLRTDNPLALCNQRLSRVMLSWCRVALLSDETLEVSPS
jgi:hypothetical protein